jgi:hypothetical protein
VSRSTDLCPAVQVPVHKVALTTIAPGTRAVRRSVRCPSEIWVHGSCEVEQDDVTGRWCYGNEKCLESKNSISEPYLTRANV